MALIGAWAASYFCDARSMSRATFRFYEELNDFLPLERRRCDFTVDCARRATTKHMIEALGIPHTEVELILVNGESADFRRVLTDGDRVSVYPRFEAFDITPLLRVRPQPLREVRFLVDAHLGALARLLRLMGFDTRYDPAWPDAQIERVAGAEHRIVLTRDRELLKRRAITHGCYVHARDAVAQLTEVCQRLDLRRGARPFTRCMRCNAPLRGVDKAQVLEAVPLQVRQTCETFSQCTGCGRVYWQGSHWRRMRAVVDRVLAYLAVTATPDSVTTTRSPTRNC
jgi:uncharacterized protein with PIN domain